MELSNDVEKYEIEGNQNGSKLLIFSYRYATVLENLVTPPYS